MCEPVSLQACQPVSENGGSFMCGRFELHSAFEIIARIFGLAGGVLTVPINARAETVAEKPSFRQAFSRHRCVIVADGFYEWKNEGGKKRPVYVHLKNGMPFGMAGLYNLWASPEGKQICTTTIITTDANETLKPIHERMPVITPLDKIDLWLDPSVHEKEKLLPILKPYPNKELELYEVSMKVNSPKNDSAENIQKIR
jgi:putative SOS response-associated peptidase YedK